MGLETVCTVLYDGVAYEPKVLLETEALVFRGALKKTIPFRDISSLVAADDAILFTSHGVQVEARVGPKAAVWVEKIRNPKSLLDKLGIRHDDAVAMVDVTDPSFREQLALRTSNIVEGLPSGQVPWIIYQADSCESLDRLPDLRKLIVSNGAIWVLHPKGRKEFQDVHVIAAAKEHGLVDVKVCAFSPTHSALKLVIPRDRRA